MIELSFVTERSPGSEVIRWFTHSDFSHVDIIWGDPYGPLAMEGMRFGARSDCPVNGKTGVQFRESGYAKFVKDWRVIVPATFQQEDKFYDWLLKQEGKPYDTTGLYASFLWNRPDWNHDTAWWCSELAGAALGQGAGLVNIVTPTNKLSPNDAFLVAGAIPGAEVSRWIP